MSATAKYFVLYEEADVIGSCADRDTAFEMARRLRADVYEAEEPTDDDRRYGSPVGKTYRIWRWQWDAWLGIGVFRPVF